MSRQKDKMVDRPPVSDSIRLWGEIRIPEQGKCSRQLPELALIFYRRIQGWTVAIDQSAVSAQKLSRGYRAYVGRWPGQTQRRMGGLNGVEDEKYDFASTHPPEYLQLLPALSDRSIVAQIGSPLVILPGHSVRLYLFSPLWAQLFQPVAGDKPNHLLLEVPLHQCDDAWFGLNTLEGEMCYAVKSPVLSEPLPQKWESYFAASPVRLINAGGEALVIERLMVPVPMLNLYESEAGQYWTQEIIYRRDETEDRGRFEVVPGVPKVVGKARMVAKARTSAKRLAVGQAWRFFFG